MRQLVFATFNRGKAREVAHLLEGLDLEVLTPPDVGIATLPPEDGETFLDNAVIKAAAVHAATGLPVFADDSGLQVDALDGAPGVHSARFAGGDGHDDRANMARLLERLQGVADRRARFACTIACLLPPGGFAPGLPANLPGGARLLAGHPRAPSGLPVLVATGFVEGRIIDTPLGTDGFGYDPVFWREDLGRTFAQLTAAQKNAFSHRGNAVRALRAALEVAWRPAPEGPS
jgi:XTP/dITP diphosphohydrolase